jgi:hypothetical protein
VDFSPLADLVGDRLIQVESPLDEASIEGALRNPYAIEDHPGAFHTTGWYGAHVTRHSPWAVAAESAADIAAARLRAAVRNGGRVPPSR